MDSTTRVSRPGSPLSLRPGGVARLPHLLLLGGMVVIAAVVMLSGANTWAPTVQVGGLETVGTSRGLQWLVEDNCTFDYPGALRPESLNCFREYFPHSAPFTHPILGEGKSFSLSGVEWKDGPPPVPIFIPFRDRVSVLSETLRSIYRYLETPYEIVIINDNTSFPTAVNFLDRLRDAGVKVHDNQRVWFEFVHLYEIWADFAEAYMKASKSDYYVLTDPDCALDSAPGNLLFIYQSVLDDKKLNLSLVGASLRWDDWGYDSERVFHEDPYVNLPAFAHQYRNRSYYYNHAAVDTTFAMYRTERRLKRLVGSHVRMLPPLGARHLDYYLNKTHAPEDYVVYHKHAREKWVNHMEHMDRRLRRER